MEEEKSRKSFNPINHGSEGKEVIRVKKLLPASKQGAGPCCEKQAPIRKQSFRQALRSRAA